MKPELESRKGKGGETPVVEQREMWTKKGQLALYLKFLNKRSDDSTSCSEQSYTMLGPEGMRAFTNTKRIRFDSIESERIASEQRIQKLGFSMTQLRKVYLSWVYFLQARSKMSALVHWSYIFLQVLVLAFCVQVDLIFKSVFLFSSPEAYGNPEGQSGSCQNQIFAPFQKVARLVWLFWSLTSFYRRKLLLLMKQFKPSVNAPIQIFSPLFVAVEGRKPANPCLMRNKTPRKCIEMTR